MANKTLFKLLIGKLVPTTDALNEERAPAYALSPKHQLAQYAATGCLNTTFYATADVQLAKRFPVNTLKIDRSFISNMAAGDENSAIVRTIITLADNLGMDVVAEGIETEAQREELRALKCDYAQGYLFSRPAQANVIEEFVRREQMDSLVGTISKEPSPIPASNVGLRAIA